MRYKLTQGKLLPEASGITPEEGQRKKVTETSYVGKDLFVQVVTMSLLLLHEMCKYQSLRRSNKHDSVPKNMLDIK